MIGLCSERLCGVPLTVLDMEFISCDSYENKKNCGICALRSVALLRSVLPVFRFERVEFDERSSDCNYDSL